MMAKVISHANLPKAKTMIRKFTHHWFFHTVRLANAREFFIFKSLAITISRPWLESSARALHPEIFTDTASPAQEQK